MNEKQSTQFLAQAKVLGATPRQAQFLLYSAYGYTCNQITAVTGAKRPSATLTAAYRNMGVQTRGAAIAKVMAAMMAGGQDVTPADSQGGHRNCDRCGQEGTLHREADHGMDLYYVRCPDTCHCYAATPEEAWANWDRRDNEPIATLAEAERRALDVALTAAHGNRRLAAKLLEVPERTLHRMIETHWPNRLKYVCGWTDATKDPVGAGPCPRPA